jgi:hypothetical protein
MILVNCLCFGPATEYKTAEPNHPRSYADLEHNPDHCNEAKPLSHRYELISELPGEQLNIPHASL